MKLYDGGISFLLLCAIFGAGLTLAGETKPLADKAKELTPETVKSFWATGVADYTTNK